MDWLCTPRIWLCMRRFYTRYARIWGKSNTTPSQVTLLWSFLYQYLNQVKYCSIKGWLCMVRWSDYLATPTNHCDVTVVPVSLNCRNILNKKLCKHIHKACTQPMTDVLTKYHIMTGRAVVVANEVFHHRNGNISTLWEWLHDEKQFLLFNEHLYLERNFNHLRLRYSDPCNFLTKRALVSQPSTALFEFIHSFAKYYIIHTQHDCRSQMNSN